MYRRVWCLTLRDTTLLKKGCQKKASILLLIEYVGYIGRKAMCFDALGWYMKCTDEGSTGGEWKKADENNG